MYKINRKKLEENLKYIKPNSLQESVQKSINEYKKIKNLDKNVSKKDTKKFTVNEKIGKVIGKMSNPANFLKEVQLKVKKGKKNIEETKEFSTESFNENVFEDKTKKDLIFLKTFYETTINNSDITVSTSKKLREKLYSLTESILKDSISLYKETNTKPRYFNLNLSRKDLTENEIENIFNESFKKYLNENFTLKLRKNEYNIDEIKKMTTILTENNVDVNIEDLIIYSLFEETVENYLKSVLIPNESMKKIHYFNENTDNSYFEIFENNSKILYESFCDGISKLASLISPLLFRDKVTDDSDNSVVDEPEKYAGVRMVCKKINDGPMMCSVKKETSDGDGESITKNIENPEAKKELEKIEKEAEKEAEVFDDDDLDPEEMMLDHEAELLDDVINDDIEDKEEKPKKKAKSKKLEESFFLASERGIPEAKYTNKYYGLDDRNANTKKDIDFLNNEEIIPDEASGVKNLGDHAEYEKGTKKSKVKHINTGKLRKSTSKNNKMSFEQ